MRKVVCLRDLCLRGEDGIVRGRTEVCVTGARVMWAEEASNFLTISRHRHATACMYPLADILPVAARLEERVLRPGQVVSQYKRAYGKGVPGRGLGAILDPAAFAALQVNCRR